jgi:hypothetical protein
MTLGAGVNHIKRFSSYLTTGANKVERLSLSSLLQTSLEWDHLKGVVASNVCREKCSLLSFVYKFY